MTTPVLNDNVERHVARLLDRSHARLRDADPFCELYDGPFGSWLTEKSKFDNR
jgi:hypothetical protein